jgi:hypothetical protein
VNITGRAREERRSLYPIAALQQRVRNAVMHRSYEATHAPVRVYWYDDRIEIGNPGGPFGIVGIENFGEPGVADYRNPNLAEAMRVLGFVQRFGFGLAIARRALEENGNPPLELKVLPSHVTAIVRAAPVGVGNLANEMSSQYLARRPPSSTHAWRNKMSTTGEKPGKGTYSCTKCGASLRLDDASDTLPPCPKCRNTEFRP